MCSLLHLRPEKNPTEPATDELAGSQIVSYFKYTRTSTSSLKNHQERGVICGTCHMALLFLPLPRTATTTICSSRSLLVVAFMQHRASHPPSASLLKLLRLYQVHSLQLSPTDRVSLSSLGKPPENSGTSFYARIRLLVRNSIGTASHLTKCANTSSRVLYFSPRSEETNASSSSSSCLHS